MAVGYEEMQVVIDIKGQGRLGPKRDINEVVLVTNHR